MNRNIMPIDLENTSKWDTLLSFKSGDCQRFLDERFADPELTLSKLFSEYKNTLGILALGVYDDTMIKNLSFDTHFLDFEDYFCSLMLDTSDTGNSQNIWSQLSLGQKNKYADQFRLECIPHDPYIEGIIRNVNWRMQCIRGIIYELSKSVISRAWEMEHSQGLRKNMLIFNDFIKNPIVIPNIRKKVSVSAEEIISIPSASYYNQM